MAQPTQKQQEALNAWRRYGSQSKAAEALGITRDAIKKRLRHFPTDEYKPANEIPSVTQGMTANHRATERGMTREQAKQAYDIPCRIKKALDAFIAGMEKGVLYTEAEVRRECRVAQRENEYWNEVTSHPEYRPYYGYTEAGMRLWGSTEEIEWAANSQDGITGFVAGMEYPGPQ